jgi:hypothetical protein
MVLLLVGFALIPELVGRFVEVEEMNLHFVLFQKQE